MKFRKTIERPLYTDRLKELEAYPEAVKILLGTRGCGKTTVLSQYIASLEDKGIPSDHIIYLDLGSMFFERVGTAADLITYVHNRLPADPGRIYLVLDSVTHPDIWAEACDTLRTDLDIDITAAVSNGQVFAVGRRLPKKFIVVTVRPLLFRKYLELFPLHDQLTVQDRFREYMTYGGLPSVDADWPDGIKKAKLKELIAEIDLLDIASTYDHVDFRHMNAVMSSLFRHNGSFLNLSTIAEEVSLPVHTVERCLQIIKQERLAVCIRAFDLKNKKARPEYGLKYYSVDLGLLNALEGVFPDPPDRYRYENAAYLELLRRGYVVTSGLYGDAAVTFFVRRRDGEAYCMVADHFTPEEASTASALLLQIEGSGRRVIISEDRDLPVPAGVEFLNITDWMLEDYRPAPIRDKR